MIDITDEELLDIYKHKIKEQLDIDFNEILLNFENRKDIEYCISDTIYRATDQHFQYDIDLSFIEAVDAILDEIDSYHKLEQYNAKIEQNGSDINLIITNPYKELDKEVSEYVKKELKKKTCKPDLKFVSIQYTYNDNSLYFMLSYVNSEKDKTLKQRLARFSFDDSYVYFQRIKDLDVNNLECTIKADAKFYSLM